eukprot:638926-Pleurochrysis_carterae.AAC.1
MENFVKPWTTMKAWFAQIVGATSLDDMVLQTRPSWDEMVRQASTLVANNQVAPIKIAWFKTRQPGAPKTAARQQSVHE